MGGVKKQGRQHNLDMRQLTSHYCNCDTTLTKECWAHTWFHMLYSVLFLLHGEAE